jgi:hypothetical protein
MGWTCSMHGVMRNSYEILVGKPEGKGPRERQSLDWDNIKVNLTNMEYWCRIWIELRLGRLE